MKLNPYSNTHKGASIGFLPLLATLLLLTLHYFSGALDWPAQGDVRAQRDFNSAVGMSVITGYFWFALRLMHQNVASTLISLLVKTNQLSQFSFHRRQLSSEFKLHIFNAIIISILITIIYCIAEELVTTKQEIDVMLLTATAVPFWLLCILFLFQISSNIKYLSNQVVSNVETYKETIGALTTVLKLGTTNSIFAMGALAIFPIFWLKKDIPSVDVMMVTFFSCVVTFYLFFPVIKLRWTLNRERKNAISMLEKSILEGIKRCAAEKNSVSSKFIEQLETEKELLINNNVEPITPRDWLRVTACITLIPVSWLLLLFTEWLIQFP